jgi:stage II sporulation protein D
LNNTRALAPRLAVLVALACACATHAPRYAARPGDGPEIRVLVDNGGAATMTAPGGVQVRAGGATLLRGDAGVEVRAMRRGTTVQVTLSPGGASAATEGAVELAPASGSALHVSGVPYAGRIRLVADGASDLLVVNVLSLERYLEGVVPHEIGAPGPEGHAAVRAQAIAARTYAIARMEARRETPFDVHASVLDQVYRGDAKRDGLASSAVRETRGQVLAHGGGLCDTYYSATCGGHTADIERAWPQRESRPYLRGRRDREETSGAAFCSWVRNFRWRLPRELGVSAARVGSLVDLRVSARDRTGRVRVLDIETTEGVFRAEGDRIRWVLSPDPSAGRILPSTMFAVERTMRGGRAAFVSLAGGGNGHGVGMCQNGAIGMARKGYSHRMILAHYYPGSEIAIRY